uniref:Uncharacterized protein n=1 Tax=Panagrolaimus superbus TaxID=310955 RepID=A0A914Z7C3_9BILA
MFSYLGVIYIYLLLFIVIFVIILSVTGRSTGVREKAADLLLATFEWAANYAVDETEMPSTSDEEDNDDDEYPPPATDDDRMSQCSNSSSNLGGIIRKRRRRPSGEQPLIARQWSESIENKLSSQTELDQLPNKDSTVKLE